MILDLSMDGSARLDIGDLETPATFVLLISEDGRVRRNCVTTGRKDHILTVRFIIEERHPKGSNNNFSFRAGSGA